jgi:hypothetical protein
MPRKKASAKTAEPRGVAGGRRSVIDKLMKVAPISNPTRDTNALRGIPLENCLPLQSLIGLDCLPLGRLFAALGAWGSTKTAFCDALSARFIRHKCQVIKLDTERKSNPLQTEGHMRWHLKWGEHLLQKLPGIKEKVHKFYLSVPLDSIETLMDTLVAVVTAINEQAPSERQPYIIYVDSIAATGAKVDNEKILGGDEGNNINNMANAQNLKRCIMALNTLLSNLPVLVVFINQQNIARKNPMETKGETAASKVRENTPGGGFKEFIYSGQFEMSPITAGKDSKDWILGPNTMPHIRITMKKSCFSLTTHTGIVVPYRTEHLPSEDGPQEVHWYDWDASLTHLLHKTIGPKKLEDFFDMEMNGTSHLYTSKALGLKSLNATDFGRAIHANKELVRILQDDLFRIKHIAPAAPLDDSLALPGLRRSDGTWDPEGTCVALTPERSTTPKPEGLAMDLPPTDPTGEAIKPPPPPLPPALPLGPAGGSSV